MSRRWRGLTLGMGRGRIRALIGVDQRHFLCDRHKASHGWLRVFRFCRHRLGAGQRARGVMNEQRTYLRGGSHIGGPRTRVFGGVLRWACSLAMTAVPRLMPCIAGLIGLVTFFGPASLCAAAESGGTADKNAPQAKAPADSQAASASAGVRNPLNAHAYMQELAAKLSPSMDKQLLLKGVPSQANGAGPQGPTAKSPAGRGMNPSSPIITAQVVQPALDGRKGKAGDKEASTPTRFMAFWGDPSLKGQPVDNIIMPYEAASDESEDKSTPVLPKSVANQGDQTPPANPREDILGPLGVTLASMKPGVTLVSSASGTPAAESSTANFAATVAAEGTPQAKGVADKAEKARWSLGADLDKYRAHAVREGSRDSGENIKKAFERAGLTLEDGVNVFLLGYASERGQPFRGNDGKGLLDEPGKVPQRAGDAVGNAGLGLYSVADLVLLNGLRDPNTGPYQDNHPVVRPLLFTGRMVGGVWKTTEEVGNAVTWGYFDNFTGTIGMCIEDILELLKNAGEAVTNIARAPVQLVAGKKEGSERAMDWVLLVPLEFIGNSIEMKGIANMQDYEAAFEDKGVIGSVVELGGSSFLVYRGTKELIDRLDDKHHRTCRTTNNGSSGGGTVPDTPPDPGTPPPPPPPDVVFLLDGMWPVENGTGAVLIDGIWTTIKTWRE